MPSSLSVLIAVLFNWKICSASRMRSSSCTRIWEMVIMRPSSLRHSGNSYWCCCTTSYPLWMCWLYTENNIRPTAMFGRILFPVMRRQVVFLLGPPHTGKTHLAEAIMEVMQGLTLSLNNHNASCDFEIAPCYKWRLCVVNYIEYSGLNILHNRMHLVNGSKGMCNQKNKDVIENVTFPPMIITGNDINDLISRNREMDNEPSRMQILFNRIHIVDIRQPLPRNERAMKRCNFQCRCAGRNCHQNDQWIWYGRSPSLTYPSATKMPAMPSGTRVEVTPLPYDVLTFNMTVSLKTNSTKLSSEYIVLKVDDIRRSTAIRWDSR